MRKGNQWCRIPVGKVRTWVSSRAALRSSQTKRSNLGLLGILVTAFRRNLEDPHSLDAIQTLPWLNASRILMSTHIKSISNSSSKQIPFAINCSKSNMPCSNQCLAHFSLERDHIVAKLEDLFNPFGGDSWMGEGPKIDHRDYCASQCTKLLVKCLNATIRTLKGSSAVLVWILIECRDFFPLHLIMRYVI